MQVSGIPQRQSPIATLFIPNYTYLRHKINKNSLKFLKKLGFPVFFDLSHKSKFRYDNIRTGISSGPDIIFCKQFPLLFSKAIT